MVEEPNPDRDPGEAFDFEFADGPPALGEGNPAEAEAGGPVEQATPDRQGWYGMLRSSEPDVRPADVASKLDVHASWSDHLACAFVKATNSSGVEAWMHIVVATFALVQEGTDATREQSSESEEADASSEEPAVGPRKYDGPQ